MLKLKKTWRYLFVFFRSATLPQIFPKNNCNWLNPIAFLFITKSLLNKLLLKSLGIQAGCPAVAPYSLNGLKLRWLRLPGRMAEWCWCMMMSLLQASNESLKHDTLGQKGPKGRNDRIENWNGILDHHLGLSPPSFGVSEYLPCICVCVCVSHEHQQLADENVKVKALRDQPCHCEGKLDRVLKLTNVYFTWRFVWKKW